MVRLASQPSPVEDAHAAQLRDATITAISHSDHERAVELAARRSPNDEGALQLFAQAAGDVEVAVASLRERS